MRPGVGSSPHMCAIDPNPACWRGFERPHAGSSGTWPISRRRAISKTSKTGRAATCSRPDGDRLGAVDQIFLDEATGTPEWVLVSLDDGAAFVPLAGASVEERRDPRRPGRRARPGRAAARGRRHADRDRKQRLYEHYGLALLAGGVPDRAARGRPRRPRRSGRGCASTSARRCRPPEAPTEAPTAEVGDRARGDADARRHQPAEQPKPAAEPMAPRPQRRHALPPAPAQAARCSRPRAASAYEVEESRGSKLRTAIPIALAGAIAALIAVLAWRRKRSASPPGRRARRARTRGRTASTRACRSA